MKKLQAHKWVCIFVVQHCWTTECTKAGFKGGRSLDKESSIYLSSAPRPLTVRVLIKRHIVLYGEANALFPCTASAAAQQIIFLVLNNNGKELSNMG